MYVLQNTTYGFKRIFLFFFNDGDLSAAVDELFNETGDEADPRYKNSGGADRPRPSCQPANQRAESVAGRRHGAEERSRSKRAEYKEEG